MTYPTLRCFDPDKECFVYTDSSQFHCGGSLIQFHDALDDSGKPTGEKNPCAVAYHSRSFIDAESKYSSRRGLKHVIWAAARRFSMSVARLLANDQVTIAP
eukprot:COSAG05_NODE_327_length_11345_cov_16.236884_4_plen_101_part_00